MASPAAPPRYILTMPMIRLLLIDLQNVLDRYHKAMATMAPAPEPIPNSTGPPPPPPPSVVESKPQLPGVPMPQASQASPSIQARVAPPLTANAQIVKSTRKLGQSMSTIAPTASTPSPAAAQTPVHAALTPPTIPASSPRTPKSPPKKAAPKPKPPPKRRVSKVVQPEAGPSKPTGTKRPREDEPTPSGLNTAQPERATDEPSPKRAKRVDWDGAPSQEVEKRQQEVDTVESNQDVQAYLARATEDFLVSGTAEGHDGASEDLSRTLQELFNGMPTDVPDSFPGPSESSANPSSPKPSDNAMDLFAFIDFSQFEDCEPVASTSKIDTPDLVHASSTNPSPESVAETPKGENAAIASNRAKDGIRIADDANAPNPLALGTWPEIHGGEPAFYDHPRYKWEGDMPVQDDPWAMSAGT